jgi:hypothetical protein
MSVPDTTHPLARCVPLRWLHSLLDPFRDPCRSVESLDQADSIGRIQSAVHHNRGAAEIGRETESGNLVLDDGIDTIPSFEAFVPSDLPEGRISLEALLTPYQQEFAGHSAWFLRLPKFCKLKKWE